MTIVKKTVPRSQSTGVKGKSAHITKTTGGKKHGTAPKAGHISTNSANFWGSNKSSSLEGKFKDFVGLSNIVDIAMKGVTVDIFYAFATTIDMPDKYLAEILNTTARTLSNYKEQRKPLEPVKGEHLLKIIELFKKGEELFGTLGEFRQWLSKPKAGSKRIPMELMITPGGVDLISKELDRIAYGYVF